MSGRARRPRRRARLALFVLGAFSLAGGAWLLAQSSLLDLEKIEVRGVRHTRPAEVTEAAAVSTGDPLLLVNRGAVADRVERLPWVGDADVGFSLPGTLVVTVDERAAVAWVRDGADGAGMSAALLDAEGRVLDRRDAAPERLAELRVEAKVPGPGRYVEGVEGPLRIASGVPPALRARVQAVVPASGGWVLSVEGVEIVRFGPATDVERKWAALEAVLERLGDRPVYLVDVRVPSVPAVKQEKALPTTTTTLPG